MCSGVSVLIYSKERLKHHQPGTHCWNSSDSGLPHNFQFPFSAACPSPSLGRPWWWTLLSTKFGSPVSHGGDIILERFFCSLFFGGAFRLFSGFQAEDIAIWNDWELEAGIASVRRSNSSSKLIVFLWELYRKRFRTVGAHNNWFPIHFDWLNIDSLMVLNRSWSMESNVITIDIEILPANIRAL